jgi:hypothetical protein
MKVVIHAGVHRTGTTSLQYFLAANRQALRERGFVYPGEEPNHQNLAWAIKRGEVGAEQMLGALGDVGPEETAILSGEDFSILTDLGWLRDLAAHVPVEAVFYLRRQDHWLASWYNQHVKWPFDHRKSKMSPQDFLGIVDDFHWIDYETLLDRWARALGDARIKVRVVEPGQVDDVTQDFLARLGLSAEGLEPLRWRENPSLPVHVLEIARTLGLFELRPAQRTRLLEALRKGLSDKAPDGAMLYAAAEREALLRRFEVSNAAVARRFLGRPVLFEEPAPDPGAVVFRFPELSRERLLEEWIAPVIHALLEPRR